ncbi:MAG: ferredoxin [Candidatus Omnitrophica bacterium]|nr:ferredoxin [Candidatus Omnitrophota bacterium]
MKVIVDQEICIGCGLCPQICPDIFLMEIDKAKVLVDIVPKEMEDCTKEAADGCPVEAIIIK